MTGNLLKKAARKAAMTCIGATAALEAKRPVDFSKFELVSFDMFDTLATRLVARSRDVFSVVEARALHEGLDVAGFSSARMEAEHVANAKYGYSASIRQIYDSFPEAFADSSALGALEEMEREAELDLCVPKAEGQRLYTDAKATGIRIAIVSDMYMPSELLAKTLRRCGYDGWELLLVSCEHDASKANGQLYEVLKCESGCPADRIIHIGDNLGNDIGKAHNADLATHFITRQDVPATGIADSFMKGSARAFEHDGHDGLESFGYRALGPVLVGYCGWLSDQLAETHADGLAYLARDARVLQQAMDSLGYEAPRSSYLHVSRRSLRVPAFMASGNVGELIAACELPEEIGFEALLLKLGFSERDAVAALKSTGTNPRAVLRRDGLEDNKRVIGVLGWLRGNSEEGASQLNLVRRYLTQSGLGGRVVLSDIGWSGNIQVALRRILAGSGHEATLLGRYLGVWPKSPNQASDDMTGFLFDANHGQYVCSRELSYHRLFECLFTDESGTTVGYENGPEGVVAVLGGYGGKEAELGHRTAAVRRGALAFVVDWARAFHDARVPVSPELAMREMDRTFLYPNAAEAEAFGEWELENEGEFALAARPAPLGHYLAHPGHLLADYRSAPWHVGFLRRVGKLPLPYARFLGLDSRGGGPVNGKR